MRRTVGLLKENTAMRITVPGAIAFLLLGGSGFGQENAIATFTGVESGKVPGNPSANLPVRGVIKCLGLDNPTPADGDFAPWCPAGTWTTVRGRVLSGKWETSDPNTTGSMLLFFALNLDSTTFTGPVWGTFILDVPGKGTWEGSFAGEYAGQRSVVRYLGNGDGQFQGSTIMAEAIYEAMGVRPGAVTGRYLRGSAGKSSLSAASGAPESVSGLGGKPSLDSLSLGARKPYPLGLLQSDPLRAQDLVRGAAKTIENAVF
jgi:hypothetical protein